jgi:hypothetical protein
MYKPMAFLLLASAIVAAPGKLPREGLASYSGIGKLIVVKKLDELHPGENFVVDRLAIDYAVAGTPGATYTVELWLGRTGWVEPPYHFDTQTVTVPADAKEAKGRFGRRVCDRPPTYKAPYGSRFAEKPGEYALFSARPGPGWDCRLVIKRNGKVLTDTGYFPVVRKLLVEI